MTPSGEVQPERSSTEEKMRGSPPFAPLSHVEIWDPLTLASTPGPVAILDTLMSTNSGGSPANIPRQGGRSPYRAPRWLGPSASFG